MTILNRTSSSDSSKFSSSTIKPKSFLLSLIKSLKHKIGSTHTIPEKSIAQQEKEVKELAMQKLWKSAKQYNYDLAKLALANISFVKYLIS